MGQLRAGIDGLEVVVNLEEGTTIPPDLGDALGELAEAMYAQQMASAGPEVEGFGLSIGGLGFKAGGAPITSGVRDCWGFGEGGHCGWYSDTEEDRNQPGGPTSCTIRNFD